MAYEWYWWWPFWICSAFFAVMMLVCIFAMFLGMRGKFRECFQMMHSSDASSIEELKHEIKALKEEIKKCRGEE